MQKLILYLFLLAGITFSCNNASTTAAEPAKDTAAAATTAPAAVMNYPYTIEHPDYWEIGDPANTMIALSSLKAWEEGKLDESLKNFADSVHIKFAVIDKVVSKDSLKAFFAGGLALFKNVKIKMGDWESVISKDKKEEWVTLWYKQIWDTKKGGKDSADYINDIKIKDGKIVRLDEYTRQIH